MSSSTLRDHRASVDMPGPPLTGGDHGDDKSRSRRNCRVGFVRQIGTDLLSTLSKNSDLSDALRWICHEVGWQKVAVQ